MTALEEIERLIARVAMGDRRAFGGLYEKTSAKLFGIAVRVLRDDALAEEVLQEVFLRIWHRADSYKSNGYSPMTWLITITRNAAIDRLRKARRDGTATEPVEIAERLYDPAPGPETQTVMRDEARALEACLDELDEGRAEMVRKAYLQGVTYAELSETTGVKLNTVRTWLRRSLLQLRECLSQ